MACLCTPFSPRVRRGSRYAGIEFDVPLKIHGVVNCCRRKGLGWPTWLKGRVGEQVETQRHRVNIHRANRPRKAETDVLSVQFSFVWSVKKGLIWAVLLYVLGSNKPTRQPLA